MHKTAITLLAVALAAPASAATWISAGHPAARQFLAYYDVDSVMRTGGSVTVWNRWVYKEPIAKKYDVVLHQTIYNCSSRTTVTLTSLAYDVSGTPLPLSSTPTAPEPVVPDTFGEGLFNFFCNPAFPSNVDKVSAAVENPDAISRAAFDLIREDEAKRKKP